MKKCIGICSIIVVCLLAVVLTNGDDSASNAATANVDESRTSRTLSDCLHELETVDGGWCELRVNSEKPGIASVWPKPHYRVRHSMGPKAVMIAWGSAAWDADNKVFYFMGGGGNDYGGNEVYRFSLLSGTWKRITSPSLLDHWVGGKRPFWIPDTRTLPAASYLNDGIIFNRQTGTIFVLAGQASHGARVLAEENPPAEKQLSGGAKSQQYEFNPSESETRNGLAPLTWRRIGEYAWRKGRSVQLPDDTLLLGDYQSLYTVRQGEDGQIVSATPFHKDRKSRGGNAVYDPTRKWVWTIYIDSLVAIDGSGRQRLELKLPMKSSRALAFDQQGNIVIWDGGGRIYTLDPDQKNARWKLTQWQEKGPYGGYGGRVFGKWVHLGDNIFAGISSNHHGVWIYKHPQADQYAQTLSNTNIQRIVKHAKKHSTVKLPAGRYPFGLRISKPLTVDMTGVELLGVSGGKGILEISVSGEPVKIRNFKADAKLSGAKGGNLAGIRISGKNFDVTLEDVHIRNTALGVMTDNRGGKLKIVRSTFEDIGRFKRKGLSHIVYAGAIDSLELIDSRLQKSMHLGHLLKSRAQSTRIQNTKLLGMDGNHSRVIDLACGGNLMVENSILQSSSNTDNQDLISIGVEKPANCKRGLLPGHVTLKDNVIVFDRVSSTANKNRLFTWRTEVEHLSLSNNIIVDGDGQDLLAQTIDNTRLADKSDNNRLFSTRREAGITTGTNQAPVLSGD